MKYLAVLGRQPEISLSELRALFGAANFVPNSGRQLAEFDAPAPVNLARLGGTIKLARPLEKAYAELPGASKGQAPVSPLDYLSALPEGKITLGISDYSKDATSRSAQTEALKFKKILIRHGRNVRVLPNLAPTLASATSFRNKLGAKPTAVELIKLGRRYFVSLGAQNITAYAHRDQNRPARDAKNGMLPPKLAQILINLNGPLRPGARLLDPFCGSGVVLQEAALMGFTPYGTDLNPKMAEYSRRNLDWLQNSYLTPVKPVENSVQNSAALAALAQAEITSGDATKFQWQAPIDAVACETYLGPPLSAPPADLKLKELQRDCRSLTERFLNNLAPQLAPGTPVTLAVPAWLRSDGSYARLNFLDEFPQMGYNEIRYQSPSPEPLLYHRNGQVVAREIIHLRKI